MNHRELLHHWNVPHLTHFGVTLVARENAEKCLRLILENNCRLHGYEGFTLLADNTIQPHMEWSAS